MRRRVAEMVLGLLVGALGVASACSNNDASGPSAGGTSSQAGAGTSTGGEHAAAGAKATDGGETNGGAAPQGGANGNTTAGTPAGGATDQAGAGAEGGATSPPAGGAGGAAGEIAMPGPPDLITSTGGPWPDSLTGACASPTKLIPCPQKDDPFFGQDGTYRINVPKYSTTLTTIKDSVTGLVWQLKPSQTAKTQAEAVAYCDALDLAGQTDWRLATRLEYVSLLDEGMGAGYALPPGIPLDATGVFWTASATGTTVNGFYVMDDRAGVWNVAVGSSTALARCVRGTALSSTLTADTDFVTDSMTKLVWQTTSLDDSAATWQAALDYCETLSHAGKDDWRLPSIKELATIVDETASMAPVISADFGAGMASAYWSSTPAPSLQSDHFAFALEMSFGISPSLKMADSAAAARCVRTAD